jgi:hypothetical protein
MCSQEIQSDAQFYNLIHQLKGTPPDSGNHERRNSRRYPFLCQQRIAPWRDTGKLAQADFIDVRCHDLNQAGFSFLLPVRPQFTSIVAALASATEEIYLIAKITHCAEVLVYPSGRVEPLAGRPAHVHYRDADGGISVRMFQLGCRFTGRIDRPE